MDRIVLKKSLQIWIGKYRIVILILLVGFLFLCFPTQEEKQEQKITEATPKQESLEDALGRILTNIAGAGKVEVLLTELHGESILYQSNENRSGDSMRSETVILTNGSREEAGLVRQVDPPVYQGALVVCEGAGNANVRLSIVQAIMSLTGLTSDRITVLKMK